MSFLQGSRHLAAAAVLLALGSAAAAAQSKDPFRSAPPEVESALRNRVEAFYGYFREAKFRQAEQLVLEESRDLFYNAKKARIFGYEVRTMNFSEDLSEANVLVTCMTLVSGLGSKPLSMPLQSTWKSVDGEWFLFFQTREVGEHYDTPAGKMHFNQNAPGPGSLREIQPATLESLKGMYAATPTSLEFSRQASEPVTKTFRVENRSKGGLTLETASKGMPGVTLDLAGGEIAAGETLTVSVTYVAHELTGPGEHRLHFAVQPIAQYFDIKLRIE